MANYPTSGPGFFQREGSREEWLDDVEIDRSVNGVVKGRSFYTVKKRVWTIEHIMNNTDRLTLEAFYDANRTIPFIFLWMGNNTSYTALFARAPQLKYKGAMANVEVQIVEQ